MIPFAFWLVRPGGCRSAASAGRRRSCALRCLSWAVLHLESALGAQSDSSLRRFFDITENVFRNTKNTSRFQQARHAHADARTHTHQLVGLLCASSELFQISETKVWWWLVGQFEQLLKYGAFYLKLCSFFSESSHFWHQLHVYLKHQADTLLVHKSFWS